MKTVSGKRMCRILESHGWTLERINGSHHIYTRAGTRVALSVPVHGNQDLPAGTQRAIMHQANLTAADL